MEQRSTTGNTGSASYSEEPQRRLPKVQKAIEVVNFIMRKREDKINDLIKEIKRDPFKGMGKPEPLRGNLRGYWSRRITGEHRLVYRVEGKGEEQTLRIVQARFHY